MRTCLAAATWLTAVGAVLGQPNLVVQKPVYDFGERDNSETVEHTFVLENRGDRILEIERTKTSCGCTVANLPDRTLDPGESAELTARLSLKNRRGRQTKMITVFSNDPDSPQTRLTLQGEAVSEFVIQPSRLFISGLSRDDRVVRDVQVMSTREAFSITGVENHMPEIEVEVIPVEEGKRYTVRITTRPPLETGRFQGAVVLQTDHSTRKTLPITVMGHVVGSVAYAPEQIVLSTRNSGAVTRYIVVRPGSDGPVTVTGVEAPSEDISVQTMSMGQNGYRIQLNNLKADASLNGQDVVIRTDSEAMPIIRIPIQIRGAGS